MNLNLKLPFSRETAKPCLAEEISPTGQTYLLTYIGLVCQYQEELTEIIEDDRPKSGLWVRKEFADQEFEGVIRFFADP